MLEGSTVPDGRSSITFRWWKEEEGIPVKASLVIRILDGSASQSVPGRCDSYAER